MRNIQSHSHMLYTKQVQQHISTGTNKALARVMNLLHETSPTVTFRDGRACRSCRTGPER